jgi:hypothetical protein
LTRGATARGARRAARGARRATRKNAPARAALDRMTALEAERARRTTTNQADVARQKEPRASTTEPRRARVMKMATPAPAQAGGGYRPACNLRIVWVPGPQVIPACARTAVDLDATGSDRGLAGPTLDKLVAGGTRPADDLVDGGFTKNADIEPAHAGGIRLWCPAAKKRPNTSMAPNPMRRAMTTAPAWPIGASA